MHKLFCLCNSLLCFIDFMEIMYCQKVDVNSMRSKRESIPYIDKLWHDSIDVLGIETAMDLA